MEKIKLNGYNLLEKFHYITIDNEIFFKSNVFILLTNFNKQPMSNILSKISDENYIKPAKNGRGSSILIRSEGLYEWICHSLSFDTSVKKKLINELKQQKLISNDLPNMSTKIELDFLEDLKKFFLFYNSSIKILYQVPISNYIVDFIINDLVIEYDEFEHKYYNKQKEELKEKNILENGYRLLRISNKNSNIENIALILKNIQNETIK